MMGYRHVIMIFPTFIFFLNSTASSLFLSYAPFNRSIFCFLCKEGTFPYQPLDFYFLLLDFYSQV